MTRSIFDPFGPDTERSGSRNLGPDASQGSQMPSDVTDGVVSDEEAAEYRAAGMDPPTPPIDTIDTGNAATPETATPGATAPEPSKSANPDTPGSLLSPEDDLSNPGREARG